MKKSEIYRLAMIAVVAMENPHIRWSDKEEVLNELEHQRFVNEICEKVDVEIVRVNENAEEQTEVEG